ncbi:MAG: dephospho-CoA kinase [Paracoccaceae bacterium]|nr:dephospho-CoA kinase [Paracoccaceae bacterium]MDE2673648.1 dephospho-CoA kinase [Paracoccaceae bacterium]
MKVLGITGSIGMGKSTVSRMFKQSGVPVWEADREVKKLYRAGGEAVEPLREAFGDDILGPDGIEKEKLKEKILDRHDQKKKLEEIVHPLVRKKMEDFKAQCINQKHKLAALEIPLLLESDLQDKVDYVVVVSAPEEFQEKRVMERKGMTREWFQKIKSWQLSDAEKQQRADFVIISVGLKQTRLQVKEVIAKIKTA